MVFVVMGAGGGGGAAKRLPLEHSQVRRIKEEDGEVRERLLNLQLLETRPGGELGGGGAAGLALDRCRRTGEPGAPSGGGTDRDRSAIPVPAASACCTV
ncbi:hypothetical protein ACP4OV_023571 [Aristida adscensionis]